MPKGTFIVSLDYPRSMTYAEARQYVLDSVKSCRGAYMPEDPRHQIEDVRILRPQGDALPADES